MRLASAATARRGPIGSTAVTTEACMQVRSGSSLRRRSTSGEKVPVRITASIISDSNPFVWLPVILPAREVWHRAVIMQAAMIATVAAVPVVNPVAPSGSPLSSSRPVRGFMPGPALIVVPKPWVSGADAARESGCGFSTGPLDGLEAFGTCDGGAPQFPFMRFHIIWFTIRGARNECHCPFVQ